MNTKKKIIEIANITSGVYLRTAPDGEVAYLQVGDLSMGNPVKTASRVMMTPKVENNILKDGDILFAAKGSVYLAAPYYKKEKDECPAVASTTFFVIRVKDENVLPEYLCWFLNLKNTETYIRAQQQGTGIPSVQKGVVEQLEIVVPETAIQRNIVGLADLSEREYQLRKAIAQKKKALIEQKLMNIIKQKYGKSEN